MEAVWIAVAFFFGLSAKRLGLPALVGYLFAGFALFQVNSALGIDSQSDILEHLAHIGVLLLLFTVGLKLDIKSLFKAEVIGTGTSHLALSVIIFTPVIMLFGVPLATAALISSMLAFSSTVLAAKVLEGKQELRSFHGRVTIGILIVQDLFAMALLSSSSGNTPSWLALLVLPLLLLPWTQKFIHWLLDHSGHDEVLLLCGLALALIVGGQGFHALGLSGELGALILGTLCASHVKSSELSRSLWGLKEIFLVGFFLTIGLKGTPSLQDIYFALAMVALLPLQGIAFFFLLTRFKLKARSAFLSSTALTTFSEFGLIVAAVALPEWMVPMALAVALSFLLSAPLNRFSHPLFDRFEHILSKAERSTDHPDEEPLSLDGAQYLILGLGKIGRAAYRAAQQQLPEKQLLALDSDAEKVRRLREKGWNVCYADAEHGNFWEGIDTRSLETVILAMDCPEASLITTKGLRAAGFDGTLVAHSSHNDHAEKLEDAGADRSYVTLEEAGRGLLSSAESLARSKTGLSPTPEQHS